MKKLFLILSTTMLLALNVFAQTPYDNFAPEQGVKSMIEMPVMQFNVVNSDSINEIHRVEFDKNTLSLNLMNVNDSVIKTIILNLNDKKFISIDPHAENYYSISPYAYCNNNPVNCIDPDGRDWYLHNETGNYYWQEGHDQLKGYTNVGSSVSIQLGENSYLNAYQNAGVMSNQAENAFDRIYSSTKLQNQFLGRNSPLSEISKSELMNAINNRYLNDEIGRPVGEAVTIALASELGGALFGKALSWGIGKIAGNLLSTSKNVSRLTEAAKLAKQWLGADAKVIQNGKGDYIFVSKDGLKKMRFDIKSSHGDLPHIHLEVYQNGKWKNAIQGSHRIYPK